MTTLDEQMNKVIANKTREIDIRNSAYPINKKHKNQQKRKN